jgi:putative ABC transport system permease protein
MGMDQDNLVILPIRAVQRRLAGDDRVAEIMVSAVSTTAIDGVRDELDALMRERRGVQSDAAVNFHIRDTREAATTIAAITTALTAFLAAVASVSLLVGGIGIMNVMLVSVTERTREIGVRLAIGALESDIRLQFLVEAAVLSGVGGAAGVVVGVSGTALAALALGVPLVLSPEVAVVAVASSCGLGVLFGWIPARRAARLEVIDAIRHA